MSNKRPLPDEIYTRRRIAAIIVLVVVIGLIVLIINMIGGKGDSDPSGVATTEETSAELSLPSSTESTTVTATGTATTETSGADEPTSSEATSTNKAASKKTCELADLEIGAQADQYNYQGEAKPKFTVQTTNPTGAECDINLDKNPVAFEVYDLATNERVWSDIDCNPSEATGKLKIPAGESTLYQADWSRTNSAPDSCSDRKPVPAGSYYLHTLVGDNHSEAVTFNIK